MICGMTVPGVTFPSGLGSSDGNVFDYRAPQVGADLSWVRGRHAMRFGFGVERMVAETLALYGIS